MLHEILLALAGHPSPIFDQTFQDSPLLTPAEAALLESLGSVASLYRALQTHLQRIVSSHQSAVCRAVASETLTSHLGQYEADLLKLESQLLSKDSVRVGAHNTVPLAYVVSSFSIWKKKLEWFWRVACTMLPEDETASRELRCSSAKILDVLSAELQTGYPFIEEAATSLVRAAHRAWLRQLSSWLLITGSPDVDAYSLNSDLFLKATGSQSHAIELDPEQIPAFVSGETASSLLFVGKCLNVLSQSFPQLPLSRPSSRQAGYTINGRSSLAARPADAVRSECLKPLKEIPLPITTGSLSKAVAAIRTSLSQQLLGRALPIDKLLQTFSYLHQYLLIGDCDFVDTLIAEADKHMALRHEQTQVGKASDVNNAIAALMLREGELSSILAKTWTALAATAEHDVDGDDDLEWAIQHLFLRLQNPEHSPRSRDNSQRQSRTDRPQPSSSFADFLVSVPVVVDLKTDSSFSLLFSTDDAAQYQAINAYLSAIRRAHLHLSKLWREEPLRKEKPAFAARPSRNRAILRLPTNAQQKAKNKQRAQKLRPIWASCSAVAATLLELGDYLSSDVVAHSWSAFFFWATSSPEALSRSTRSTAHHPTTSTDSAAHRPTASTDSTASPSSRATHGAHILAERRDPEELIQAHRQYLDTLVHSLLLTDARFTALLRELLRRIDQLIPLVHALQRAQQRVDLQDEGVLEDTRVDYALEERQAYDELMKMRRRLDTDRAQLVSRLRSMNDDRGHASVHGMGKTGFEPYRSRNGLERLLLKLDFRAADD